MGLWKYRRFRKHSIFVQARFKAKRQKGHSYTLKATQQTVVAGESARMGRHMSLQRTAMPEARRRDGKKV